MRTLYAQSLHLTSGREFHRLPAPPRHHASGQSSPSDDPMQRQPDIRLAREKLGWEPRVQLDEGLSRTIAYFDHMLATAKA